MQLPIKTRVRTTSPTLMFDSQVKNQAGEPVPQRQSGPDCQVGVRSMSPPEYIYYKR